MTPVNMGGRLRCLVFVSRLGPTLPDQFSHHNCFGVSANIAQPDAPLPTAQNGYRSRPAAVPAICRRPESSTAAGVAFVC